MEKHEASVFIVLIVGLSAIFVSMFLFIPKDTEESFQDIEPKPGECVTQIEENEREKTTITWCKEARDLY